MGKGGNLRKTTAERYREHKIINPHICMYQKYMPGQAKCRAMRGR